MSSIKIIFRPSAKLGQHRGRLYLRVIHHRKSRIIGTSLRIYPQEWNAKLQSIIIGEDQEIRSEQLCRIREQLQFEYDTLQTIINNLEEQGRYNLDDVIGGYNLHCYKDNLLYYIDKLALNLTRSGQERTARAYQTVGRKLISFNAGKDIPLKHINVRLIKDFEKDMKQEGKTLNTISFYMRNLRAIYNKAIAEKRILAQPVNPFKDVFTGVHKTKKRALNLDEIRQLDELNLILQADIKDDKSIIDESLEMARLLFLFCFHARGMSFVDLAHLRKDNIHSNNIRYYRKKTGGLIELKITPAMWEIINHFASQVKDSPYVFPLIKNTQASPWLQYQSALRRQNRLLKKLSKIAGVSKLLSTHVARHSWASIAKNENLPLWVISEGLGHGSEKVTYTYLASIDKNVLDQASDLITSIVTGSVNHRSLNMIT